MGDTRYIIAHVEHACSIVRLLLRADSLNERTKDDTGVRAAIIGNRGENGNCALLVRVQIQIINDK